MSWTERYARGMRAAQKWNPWIVIALGIILVVMAITVDDAKMWERIAIAVGGLGALAWGAAWIRSLPNESG